jgi:hypothetical protein
MKAQDLYQWIADEYKTDMVIAPREDGRSYYWKQEITRPESSRIVRISENKAGDISELKLVVNDNKGSGEPFFPLPASAEAIKNAVRHQVDLYRGAA